MAGVGVGRYIRNGGKNGESLIDILLGGWEGRDPQVIFCALFDGCGFLSTILFFLKWWADTN